METQLREPAPAQLIPRETRNYSYNHYKQYTELLDMLALRRPYGGNLRVAATSLLLGAEFNFRYFSAFTPGFYGSEFAELNHGIEPQFLLIGSDTMRHRAMNAAERLIDTPEVPATRHKLNQKGQQLLTGLVKNWLIEVEKFSHEKGDDDGCWDELERKGFQLSVLIPGFYNPLDTHPNTYHPVIEHVSSTPFLQKMHNFVFA